MKKKITPPSLDCQGLPENAFQVNQLYNVTWSNVHSTQGSEKAVACFLLCNEAKYSRAVGTSKNLRLRHFG